jgi:fructose-1,6-bisphosphatase I
MPQIAGTEDFAAYLDQTEELESCVGGAAQVLRAIAAASIEMSDLISLGRLYGQLGASRGDVQKELDVLAYNIFVSAFKRGPVAAIVSEELGEPLVLDPAGTLAVAMDPLDGSSNIDANVSIGTIFSILPVLANTSSAEAHLLQPGRTQIAAGFVIYGPQTSLVFVFGGDPTQIFTLDRRDARSYQAVSAPIVTRECAEYAINASNYRHWDAPVRAFINDCMQGTEGPLKRNHNMRWTGSLVADAYRIAGRDFPLSRRSTSRLSGRAAAARLRGQSGCLYCRTRGGTRERLRTSHSRHRSHRHSCPGPTRIWFAGNGRARSTLSQRSAIFRRARALIRQARPHASLEMRG